MSARIGRRPWLVTGVAVVALLSGGAARRGAMAPSTARTVAIAAFKYAPAAVTAAVGDTIIWRNDDIVPHTATAADGSWDSGELQTGRSWRMIVGAPGTWSYRCALHPSMVGTISVR